MQKGCLYSKTSKINVKYLSLVINKNVYYNEYMEKFGLKYFTKNISVAIGIIIIWRGVWIILDMIDGLIFGGNHIVTAILGIIIGIIILYIPDKNLKALERL